MDERVVGLLHPGEMGAAIGAELRRRGIPVLWAPESRGEHTARRAADAGLEDVGTVEEVVSGPEALSIAELFAGTAVDARVVSVEVGAASALKLAYAAWTKGTAALLLAIEAFAEAEGVESSLVAEWHESLPELPDDARRARRAADAKGWRWIGEMEEIAEAFGAHDLPDGFHRAAAEVFRTLSAQTARP